MIQKLEHHKTEVAARIREVFQASYAVEAKILGALDFPPLRRTLPQFYESPNDFYGYYKDGVLAGVVEVDAAAARTHIQSLVVHPDYFRMGIGTQLVNMVLNTYESQVFTVETGLANKPATDLYLKHGFQKTGEYDTDHGVRKVRFEKQL
jgi:ribosomal protein S18 acetylase RimI-like enzyme